MPRSTQHSFFKSTRSDYGGDLRKTRKGRSQGRPISSTSSMHLVLRSTKAKGPWSFKRHETQVRSVLTQFSRKYGVRILSCAVLNNHIHLHLKLGSRPTYKPFIRGLTGALVIRITGQSRWRPNQFEGSFFDQRPFSRVVTCYTDHLNVQDYLVINRLEAGGYGRRRAERDMAWDRRQRRRVQPAEARPKPAPA